MRTILLLAIFVAIILVSDCHRIKRSDKHHPKEKPLKENLAKDDATIHSIKDKEPTLVTDSKAKIVDDKKAQLTPKLLTESNKPAEVSVDTDLKIPSSISNKKLTNDQEHIELAPNPQKDNLNHLSPKHDYSKYHSSKGSSVLRNAHIKGKDQPISFYSGKDELKKSFKPDLDIFIYGNTGPQQLYKSSSIFDPTGITQFKGKDDIPAAAIYQYDEFAHPHYKFLQRRNPLQRAIQFANMLVKVGLDDLDSDDYGSIVEGPAIPFAMLNSNGIQKSHKSDRSLSGDKSYFCPIHALQETLLTGADDIDSFDIGGIGAQNGGEQMVCSCRVLKKS